ncbi:bile acid:sodium symporter [Shewanella sp.]|uniref:bile acid:sodium symporter family protein n=1 Tax=Shewanella sp. TaxID=50422 RepID=UPI0025878E8F|nr:bile acid:sodium symporter [Shewanella sp.]MCJ8304954.1 bile acid:sodium symporter [Shewanella sp.]
MQLSSMLEQAIALLVFLLMFIVGASLKATDFQRLQQRPKSILLLSLGQLLLLPALAWILIILFQPEPLVKNGLLLVSICPGGAVSNVYTLLAKGNAALSVSLTTLNSLLAIVTLPLLLIAIFPLLSATDTNADTLIWQQSKHLFVLLLVPVALGMLLRHFSPLITNKIMGSLECVGAIALASLLGAIFFQFQQQIVEQLASLLILATSFSLGSLLLAWCIGARLKLQTQDRVAIMFEYPVRNLALTALIASSIFKNSDYLLFAAVFFVVQLPFILCVIIWSRTRLLT